MSDSFCLRGGNEGACNSTQSDKVIFHGKGGVMGLSLDQGSLDTEQQSTRFVVGQGNIVRQVGCSSEFELFWGSALAGSQLNGTSPNESYSHTGGSRDGSDS